MFRHVVRCHINISKALQATLNPRRVILARVTDTQVLPRTGFVEYFASLTGRHSEGSKTTKQQCYLPFAENYRSPAHSTYSFAGQLVGLGTISESIIFQIESSLVSSCGETGPALENSRARMDRAKTANMQDEHYEPLLASSGNFYKLKRAQCTLGLDPSCICMFLEPKCCQAMWHWPAPPDSF